MTNAYMPASVSLPAAPHGASLPIRIARWLIPDRRDGIVALALLLGVWLSNTFGILALFEGPNPESVAAFALWNFTSTVGHLLTVAAVARWSVTWNLDGWRHPLLLALAMATVLFAHTSGQMAAARSWPDLPGFSSESTAGVDFANPSVAMSVAALWFPLGLLLAAQFQRSARERSARARLDTLLREQRRAQRRFAEARLQQIQSRIDPELLFEMLEHLRRLYGIDATRAERLLDELIDFLRTVLPRLHSTTSTLGRELAVAASYLRLRSLADDGATELDAALPAALAESPFPPGVLLPLVDALRHGCDGDRLRIAAESHGGELRVSLSAGAASGEPALASVRTTLNDLFGSRYRLELDPLDRTTLTLTLPDEDRRD